MKPQKLNTLLCTGVVALSLVATTTVHGFGQGYGAVATGGSTVVHVTNLNDSGTGSLRAALSASGRNIVFDVSGTIKITSTLVILDNTTLNSTTKNITVTGYNVSMSGHHNIIIRNMRFREDTTGPSGKCSLQGADACYNIMIDHCSIEWGRWDCMEFTGSSHDITIQYCIIGQGIDPQYFGCLIDSDDRISIHHNLWIGNNNRNPKLKCNGQYINNVVYNWGSAGGLQGGHSSAAWKSDFLNNYFIKGPSSANDNWAFDCTSNDQWYQSGNYKDMNKNGTLNGSAITTAEFTALGVTLLSSKQHNPSTPVTVDSASSAVSQAAGGSFGCQPNDSYDNTLTGYLRSYGTQGKIGK
jgi:pectate lyase